MQASKLLATVFVALVATQLLHADELHFQFHRFGHIAIETSKGRESVVIETYDKEPGSEHIIFKSRLILSDHGGYTTPKGTVFALKHLSEEIINDGNRHINSGDWQLTVSGASEEFSRLKPKMPTVEFGDTPPLVYLGHKSEAAPEPSDNVEQAEEALKKADSELNTVYAQRLKVITRVDTRENFIRAQRAWIAFRDAEAEFRTSIGNKGGIVYAYGQTVERTALTKERIRELLRYRKALEDL